MAMPLDVTLLLDNGDRKQVIIPVNDKFVKRESQAIIAKPWFGWGNINDRYILQLSLPSPVRSAIIDTSGRLADLNRLDNVSGFGVPVAWHFDNMKLTLPTLNKYDIWLRPSILYNARDGLKPGIHWTSNYLPSNYLQWWNVDFGLWYGPLSNQTGYQLEFHTPVQSLGRLTNFQIRSQVLEGREWHTLGFYGQSRKLLDSRPFYTYAASLHRNEMTNSAYLPSAQLWERGRQEFFRVSLGYSGQIMSGIYNIRGELENSLFDSDFSYSKSQFVLNGTLDLLPKITARYRVVSLISYGNPPVQRGWYIAGASPADATEMNWMYRSTGTLSNALRGNGHLNAGGGLNLRGYLNQETQISRGLAGNFEFGMPNPLTRWNNRWFRTGWYLFFDTGTYRTQVTHNLQVRSDGGTGFIFSFPWIPESLGKYNLRLDFPVWVSRPVNGENTLAGRWLIGIGRSW